jgi:tRNA (uracil-5-)-methyltransferase
MTFNRLIRALRTGLSKEQLVNVLPTIPSPLQYAYRTKLTPHFEAPPLKLTPEERLSRLAIGFETKGRKKILDIEECPIATSTVNEGMTRERQKVKETLGKFKRGATLLLRHSMKSFDSPEESECISDHKAIVRENVAGFKFEFNAGEPVRGMVEA